MADESTNFIKGARQYVHEVRSEMDKIVWPQQDEALAGTIGVVIVVVVIATLLGIVDFGLSRIMQFILR